MENGGGGGGDSNRGSPPRVVSVQMGAPLATVRDLKKSGSSSNGNSGKVITVQMAEPLETVTDLRSAVADMVQRASVGSGTPPAAVVELGGAPVGVVSAAAGNRNGEDVTNGRNNRDGKNTCAECTYVLHVWSISQRCFCLMNNSCSLSKSIGLCTKGRTKLPPKTVRILL